VCAGACIARILQWLARLVVDADLGLVETAAACLRTLLRIPAVAEAHAREAALHDALVPYVACRAVAAPPVDLQRACLPLGDARLWCPEPTVDYDTWVRELCRTLLAALPLHDSGSATEGRGPGPADHLRHVWPMCSVCTHMPTVCCMKYGCFGPILPGHLHLQAVTEFCEFIVPHAVHALLLHTDDARPALEAGLKAFFRAAAHARPDDSAGLTRPVHTVLETLAFLRAQPLPPALVPQLVPDKYAMSLSLSRCGAVRDAHGHCRTVEATAWDSAVHWVALDLLDVAATAYHAGRYFAALQYTELHCTARGLAIDGAGADIHDLLPVHLRLLEDIYARINEPDGLAGAVFSLGTRARYLEAGHERDVGAMLQCEDLLRAPGPAMGRTLRLLAYDHVLHRYTAGPGAGDELRLDLAWRNSQWEHDPAVLVLDAPGSGPGAVHSHYAALRALGMGDDAGFDGAWANLIGASVAELERAPLEDVRAVYPVVAQLQCAVELAEARALLLNNDMDAGMDLLAPTTSRWAARLGLVQGNAFEYIEPCLQQRYVVLKMLNTRALSLGAANPAARPAVAQALVDTLQGYAAAARGGGHYHAARRACSELRHMAGGEAAWALEMAEVEWADGRRGAALRHARAVLRWLDGQGQDAGAADVNDARLRARAMLVCGRWEAQQRTLAPAVIIGEYLSKGIALAQAHAAGQLGDAYHTLAVFADEQYEATRATMASSAWESAEQLRQEARAELERWQWSLRGLGLGEADKDHRSDLERHIRRTKLELQLDGDRVRAAHDHKARFLAQALENYLLSLQHGATYDAQAFRVTSLWVDNCTEAAVHDAMAAHLPAIQPHKFLPLVYQLAARIDARPAPDLKNFHALLNGLLARMTDTHPYHTLHVLIALSNGGRGDKQSAVDEAKARAPSHVPCAISVAIVTRLRRLRRRTSSSSVCNARGRGCIGWRG
jgi:ataxia telangiectasia mutated family protein